MPPSSIRMPRVPTPAPSKPPPGGGKGPLIFLGLLFVTGLAGFAFLGNALSGLGTDMDAMRERVDRLEKNYEEMASSLSRKPGGAVSTPGSSDPTAALAARLDRLEKQVAAGAASGGGTSGAGGSENPPTSDVGRAVEERLISREADAAKKRHDLRVEGMKTWLGLSDYQAGQVVGVLEREEEKSSRQFGEDFRILTPDQIDELRKLHGDTDAEIQRVLTDAAFEKFRLWREGQMPSARPPR